ncbi:MAG: glutamate-cysteine ligase family protein [Thermoproteota archaeon]
MEAGERFTIDKSIGSEYITKPFESVIEASYSISKGLGKYIERSTDCKAIPLPIGSWNDRFAGAHFHIGLDEKGLRKEEALGLASYIHDHIPFIIAVSANSPIWRRRITSYSSNRMLRGGDKYCIPVVKGELNQNHYREMNFNVKNTHKPSTLELRVCDSNIPPYICTVMMILRILTLAWRDGKKACNNLTYETYLQTRVEAAQKGVRAMLCWNGNPVTVGEYLRLLIASYRDEVSVLDIPREVFETFSLLENGWNNAEVIRYVAIRSHEMFGKEWEKDMAVKLSFAMKSLLNGGSLKDYHKSLRAEDLLSN